MGPGPVAEDHSFSEAGEAPCVLTPWSCRAQGLAAHGGAVREELVSSPPDYPLVFLGWHIVDNKL